MDVMKNENDEEVVCVYDESAVSIEQKILEVFEKYVLSHIQKVDS